MIIEGSLCCRCNQWHSHVYPEYKDGGKNVCINCLNKERKFKEDEDGN